MRAFPAAKLVKEYESADMTAKFGPIAESLGAQGYLAGESLEPKDLAAVASSLLVFSDECFGKTGQFKGRHVKLPAKLFREYSPGGSLFQILNTCFQYKLAQGWRRFDFKTPAKQEQLIEMLAKVEATLKESGALKTPTCFVSELLPSAEKARPERILIAKGAQVVASSAEASHTIRADPPGTTCAETDSEDFLRKVNRADRLTARATYCARLCQGDF